MPRKRKGERHIIPCPNSLRLRAVWRPKVIDREQWTQVGGFVWLQAFDVGWHTIDTPWSSAFADTAIEALAQANALFERPEVRSYIDSFTKENKV